METANSQQPSKEETDDSDVMSYYDAIARKRKELSVKEFSMLPLQAGMKVETPDGIGDYEGITSSGIVKVFIAGGIKEFSWSECTPKIMLRHVLMMEDFITKWGDLHSTPSPSAEKPDFDQKAREFTEKNKICFDPLFLLPTQAGFRYGYKECWQSHVVPLQQRLNNLRFSERLHVELNEKIQSLQGLIGDFENTVSQLESSNKDLIEALTSTKTDTETAMKNYKLIRKHSRTDISDNNPKP